MSEEEATPLNPQDEDAEVKGVYKEFPFRAKINREVLGGISGRIPLMIVAGRASLSLTDPAIAETGRKVAELAGNAGPIGRIEKDEFAILMPGATAYQAFDLALNISGTLPSAFIGISFVKVGDQPSIFIQRASDALRKSREDTSKNRITAVINTKSLPASDLPPNSDQITLINKWPF